MPRANPTATDPGTPFDLLPTSGRIAKDRATYQSIYLVDVPENDELRVLDGPIDLTEPLELYEKPAEGVIVTTEQEWVPKGVGLGRLLHSLSLAPGESTRVAVVDWSRQVAARTAQATTQTEAVAEEAARHRGVSEVTEALAREEQSGATTATSATTSSSSAASVGISFFNWGAGGSTSRSSTHGVATNVSRSSGYRDLSSHTSQKIAERTEQLATSSRDQRATMVLETSEAEASTVSTRVITNYNHMHALTIEYWEVIQEYELRTRTKRCDRCVFIPMKVLRFDDAVFKRYKPVLVAAALGSWAEKLAAIDPFETAVYRTRSSSGESGTWDVSGSRQDTVPMGLHPPRLIHLDWTQGEIEVAIVDPGVPTAMGRKFTCFGITDDASWPAGAVGWDADTETWTPLGLCELRSGPPAKDRDGNTWSEKGSHRWKVSKVEGQVCLSHMPPGATAWGPNLAGVSREFNDREHGRSCRIGDQGLPEMSRTVEWVSPAGEPPRGGSERLTVAWDESGVRGVKLSMRDDADCTIGEPVISASTYTSNYLDFDVDERVTQIVFTNDVAAGGPRLRRITITTDRKGPVAFGPPPADACRTTDEQIDLRDGVLCGLFGSVDARSKHVVSLGFQVRGPHVRQDVIDHLNDNELHYSRAIWANADELSLTRILANYQYDDGRGAGPIPLAARLDPTPAAMTGNYLGFRWHFPDETQRRVWMKGQGLVEAEHDDDTSWQTGRVSLPTAGVFAEAVLGRSNAAEKLDITRFWDWQTSPIPILPAEIAPVDTGSRARDVTLEPGELAPSLAAIHALSQLPEPTGAGAGLQAIAAGNLFRDLSGLEATSTLLQKGLELAAQNDWRSAEQATKVMHEANEHMENMSKIAVDAAKEVAPLILGPGGAAAAVGNSSKLGALLNFAADAAKDATAKGSTVTNAAETA